MTSTVSIERANNLCIYYSRTHPKKSGTNQHTPVHINTHEHIATYKKINDQNDTQALTDTNN